MKKSIANDTDRVEIIKDDLMFAKKLIVSKKRIVTFVKMKVPEDEIKTEDEKQETKKEQQLKYKVHVHSFGIKEDWNVKIVLV